MTHTRIKVLIVDDHPMVQDGLRLFINMSPGLECAGQAQSGEEAIRMCQQLKPDVILMDLVMPGMGGIQAIKKIRQATPAAQIVALTSFTAPELVQQALAAGAVGYVLKNVRAAELADAIRAAYNRQRVLAPEATEALVQAMQMEGYEEANLSDREIDVLRLVAESLTNIEISTRLWIAESTVRYHVSNIFSKLGARNRAEAVRMAVAPRLI
jgi:NarL family two-component system response regulator LiaR